MDTGKAQEVIERAFADDIEDGTVEVRQEGGATVVDEN
jgi:hypothetical protein